MRRCFYDFGMVKFPKFAPSLGLTPVIATKPKMQFLKTYNHTFIWVFILIAFSFSACKWWKKEEYKDNTVVATYKGEKLYLHELQLLAPKGVKGNDSLEYANAYLQQWLEAQAIIDKAKKDISNLDEVIAPQVKQLTQFAIRQVYSEYILKDLDSVVTYEQMNEHYKRNTQGYKTDVPYFQCFYIKTLSSSNTSQLVSWLNSGKEEDHKKLIQWCVSGNAVAYKLDSSLVSKSELMQMTEGFYGNVEKAKPNTVHTYNAKENGTSYTYFILIWRIINKDEVLPLSGIKEKITFDIMNKRKSEFVEATIKRIAEEAKTNGDFKISTP